MGPSVDTLGGDKCSPFWKGQDVAFATLLNKTVKPRTIALWEMEEWTVMPFNSLFNSRQVKVIFHYSTVFRPILGSTQPPIRWIPGDNLPEVKR
jgi:hypothetical protein